MDTACGLPLWVMITPVLSPLWSQDWAFWLLVVIMAAPPPCNVHQARAGLLLHVPRSELRHEHGSAPQAAMYGEMTAPQLQLL